LRLFDTYLNHDESKLVPHTFVLEGLDGKVIVRQSLSKSGYTMVRLAPLPAYFLHAAPAMVIVVAWAARTSSTHAVQPPRFQKNPGRTPAKVPPR